MKKQCRQSNQFSLDFTSNNTIHYTTQYNTIQHTPQTSACGSLSFPSCHMLDFKHTLHMFRSFFSPAVTVLSVGISSWLLCTISLVHNHFLWQLTAALKPSDSLATLPSPKSKHMYEVVHCPVCAAMSVCYLLVFVFTPITFVSSVSHLPNVCSDFVALRSSS